MLNSGLSRGKEHDFILSISPGPGTGSGMSKDLMKQGWHLLKSTKKKNTLFTRRIKYWTRQLRGVMGTLSLKIFKLGNGFHLPDAQSISQGPVCSAKFPKAKPLGKDFLNFPSGNSPSWGQKPRPRDFKRQWSYNRGKSFSLTWGFFQPVPKRPELQA